MLEYEGNKDPMNLDGDENETLPTFLHVEAGFLSSKRFAANSGFEPKIFHCIERFHQYL